MILKDLKVILRADLKVILRGSQRGSSDNLKMVLKKSVSDHIRRGSLFDPRDLILLVQRHQLDSKTSP